MNRKKQQQTFVYIILACVALVVLVIAIASGGGGGGVRVPGAPPSGGGTTPPGAPAPSGGTPSGGTSPTVMGTLTPQQQSALQRLSQASSETPSVLVEGGVIRFLTADVQIPDSAASGANAKVENFLNSYSDLFQLNPATSQLVLASSNRADTGITFVRFSQQIQGIPVFGSDMIISINDSGHIDSVNAGYIPNPVVNTTPTLSEADALNIATQDQGAAVRLLGAASLTIYDPLVFGKPSPGGSSLAWLVEVENQNDGAIYTYLIHAQTGQILDKIYAIQTARNREVWDANNLTAAGSQAASSSTLVMNESGVVTGITNPDADADPIWRHLGEVYDYYSSTHKRDSYDGAGATLKSYIDVNLFCRNAAWISAYQATFYCDGVTSLDVVAHELTHAVTSREAALVYQDESGALNESYSDVFAAMIENTHPWLITWDDAGTDIMRNMGDPATGYPSKVSEWVDPGEGLCTGDQEMDTGCVHSNSSIPNLAAYFLSEGGEQDGIKVTGIGRAKVQYIYYDTLTNRLTANSNFLQTRLATRQACDSLVGSHNITQADCAQVERAFSAVGIGITITVPGGTVLISSNTSTVLVFDASGSMDEPDPSGMTKLEAAQKAGGNILDIIDAENQANPATASQIGIVQFNTYVDVKLQLSTDMAAARTALQSMNADLRTGMPDGLKAGIDLLASRPAGSSPMIILLSDGLPNIGLNTDLSADITTIKQQVLDLASQAGSQGICIYTIGFGDPTASGIDPDFLRQVASTSGCGDYYSAQASLQLANVYVDVRHTSTGNVLLQQDGQIAQDQQVTVGSVEVPSNQSEMLFTLNWPGSQLDPVLIDPKGQQVASGYPGATFRTTNTLATVIIQNPLAGAWQVLAKGVDVPQASTYYHAVVSVRANTAPAPQPTSAGFPVALLIILLGGSAVAIYVLFIKTQGRRPALAGGGGFAPPPGEAHLMMLSGPYAGQSISVYDGLTIGRNRTCGICLVDPSVSRQHAILRYSDGGWFIQDQGSTGGTYINNVRLNAARLRSGDNIRIGNQLLEFRG